MKVSIIAAVAKNGVIGINNHLPWYLPEDLAFFKKTTLGCPVLMGRKTYESINRPLPGRLNIVLSKQVDWHKEKLLHGIITYPNALPNGNSTQIATAQSLSDALTWLANFERVFLIGGSMLYQQALDNDLVNELILTEIQTNFDGDTNFPKWNRSRFTEIDRNVNPGSKERDWGFDFVKYVRVSDHLIKS